MRARNNWKHLEKHLYIVLLVSKRAALEHHVLTHSILCLRNKLLLAALKICHHLLEFLLQWEVDEVHNASDMGDMEAFPKPE